MGQNFRPLAIYLPQFHPIPENDEWWGKGFTEWTNVTKAKPLFKSHYQPHLPTELGFYDLRLNQTFKEQISLAQEAGIYGFMFYHYWFKGKRLLEQPLDNFLKDSTLDFPFCLCWANETWSRRWSGEEKEILIKQEYSIEDHRYHFESVISKFIADERYIKVDGKPVIAIYKTEDIPQIECFSKLWREMAQAQGFPDLYFIKIESFNRTTDPQKIGFDAALDFQPNWEIMRQHLFHLNLFDKVITYFVSNPFLSKRIRKIIQNRFGKDYLIIDFKGYLNSITKYHVQNKYKKYPCIMPGWDNTARRKKNGVIFYNSSPENYKKWLDFVLNTFKPFSKQENFIFINAWNEWAEGNHLEPCVKWGNRFLQVTKEVLRNNV